MFNILQNAHIALNARSKAASSTLTTIYKSSPLSSLRLTWDTNCIHGGNVMWFLLFFIDKEATEGLSARMKPRATSSRKFQMRMPLHCSGREKTIFWKPMLGMGWLLKQTLRPWGSLSYWTRLLWSTLSHNEWRPTVAIECTKSMCWTTTLWKDSRTPSTRACAHSGPRASMQQQKSWKNMHYS